jgi:hypothetical protein
MSEEIIEQAVIDRFEGAYAVLLVGAAQQPLDVPRQQLPRAARSGDWLQITLVEGALIAAQLDPAATEAARRRIQAKLERLRRGDHLKD